MPENDYNLDALLSRIKELEDKLNSGNFECKSTLSKPLLEEENKPSIKVESPKSEPIEPNYEPIAPPIEEFNLPPYEETPIITSVEKVEEKVEKAPISQPTNTSVTADAKRIWGTVVRKLRGMEGKTILWVATQEMTASLSGNTLYINVGGDSEKNLILKEENISVIREIVKTFGVLNVLVKDGNETESVDNTEKVSSYFKDTITIKE